MALIFYNLLIQLTIFTRNNMARNNWHAVAELDLYTARAAAAYFSDHSNELLETSGRRLSYVIDHELDVIEELNHFADNALLTLRRG